jgi:NO-binding membrane sensor protein with MHYT domain
MDDINPPLNQATPLLWLLALLAAWLGGHLLLGYTRAAQRRDGAAATSMHLAAAALALGSALFATMGLSMSGEPVAYVVGYRADALAAAWLLAVVASALPAALMAWRPSPSILALGAAGFGAGAASSQALTVWAAGLLPGLDWRPGTLLLAAVLQALLCAAALWLAFLGPGRIGRSRRLWRAAAAAVLGCALLIGPEIVLSAGDMATQIASAHTERVGQRALKLLSAVAVPLLLLALAAVLHLGDDAAAGAGSLSGRRRRRRRRWWAQRP